jgi:hypothetical protein
MDLGVFFSLAGEKRWPMGKVGRNCDSLSRILLGMVRRLRLVVGIGEASQSERSNIC